MPSEALAAPPAGRAPQATPGIGGAGGGGYGGYGGYGFQIGGPPASPLGPDEAEDEIDIRALLVKLWQGKWIIIVSVLCAAILGALNTSQQPLLYRATAKVMFDVQRANVEAGEAVVVQDTVAGGRLQNQVEVLRSTALIQRVVDDLNLIKNPAFNPTLLPPPEPSWWDGLSLPPEIEDILIGIGLRVPPTPSDISADPDPDWINARINRQIVELLRGGIGLRPIEGSQVLEISYVAESPDQAARIVNSVAEQYIVDQLEVKLDTFRSATTWLTERVEELQIRVETAEEAVLDAEARLAEEVGASLEVVQQQLVTLRATQDANRTEITRLATQYGRLSGALESGTEIAQLAEFRDNPAIAPLLAREDELLARDDDFADTLLPSHPSRVRIAEDLEDLRTGIRNEAGQVLQALRLELDVARDLNTEITAEIEALVTQERTLSAGSVDIRILERAAQTSRILYESLLARLEETNAQEDLQTSDARILTAAEPPLAPLRTAQNRTMMIALIAGAVLGMGLVFLLDRLNNTFRSPPQLEDMLGVPVLATVPRAGASMKRSDVVNILREKPNSSLAESIRNLRTSILYSNVDAPPKVVMFSSSVPREGKSTTSMLMALTSSQMGKSAIIVDCDLRMPALGKVLQVKDEKPGLLSVINDTASVGNAIYVEPETGLHVLMTRASERTAKINAADVLASAKFRQLIESLKSRYDLVVLDTPPTLVVTDARIVSALADAVVFCVRWDNTPRPAVKEGLRELASVGASLSGVAMTLVNESRAARYSYDGYSYYKGRYRDYYEA